MQGMNDLVLFANFQFLKVIVYGQVSKVENLIPKNVSISNNSSHVKLYFLEFIRVSGLQS